MTSFSSLDQTILFIGQIWSYKTRPGEDYSRLMINQIDKDRRYGLIYHISITRIRIKDPTIPGGIAYQLPHLPVSEHTLQKSLTTLMKQSRPDNLYLPGYKIWKKAFQCGKADIFTNSVAEIINFVESALNQ